MALKMTNYEKAKRLKEMKVKDRLIGLDVPTLEHQVEERRKREAAGKEEEREWENQALLVGNQMNLIEIEKQKIRRDMETEAREFSLQNLNKESRREFELSDPLGLKNAPPTRTGDHDERLGVSSVQIMAGEDLLHRVREKQQHQQQRSWIEHQIYEKRLKTQFEQEEEAQYAESVNEVLQLRAAIEQQERNVRGELNAEMSKHNNARAVADTQRAKQKQQEEEANARELEHWATDPFLQETRKGGVTEFKGASRAHHIGAMHDFRAQMMERQEKEFAEMSENAAWDKQSEDTRQLLLGMEHARQKQSRAHLEEVMQENLRIAEEQRARKAAEEAERKNAVVGSLF